MESANVPGTEFPIQNLPFGVLRRAGSSGAFRCAVAIGDYALDLAALAESGPASDPLRLCRGTTLNPLMAAGSTAGSALRAHISALLSVANEERSVVESCLIPLEDVEYSLPALVGDYTDFYTSIHHATNVGRLFRPNNPLLPNYEWVPIGYHGRSSSIEISGQNFPRPVGQLKLADSDEPVVAPCRRLDYELEVGIFVGEGNAIGHPVPAAEAENHIFGLCLLNDWSARDVQTWEYQPLGPFLAKNFATTISPWIVTLEALEPFREPFSRNGGQPSPLAYLDSASNRRQGAVNMRLEAHIQTPAMREQSREPQRLSVSNFNDSYWTMAQLLTHHTMNGCNLRAGDLFGSGTMSGSTDGSQAALIEITKGGKEPITLSTGESRTFLEDGDSVILKARCDRDGFVGIGFGECVGTVLPAVSC